MMEIKVNITTTGNDIIDRKMRYAIKDALCSHTIGCKEIDEDRGKGDDSVTMVFGLARPLCVGLNNGIIGCPDGCLKNKYLRCYNPGDNSCYAEL
jgi:hypothetical protein